MVSGFSYFWGVVSGDEMANPVIFGGYRLDSSILGGPRHVDGSWDIDGFFLKQRT